MRDDRSADIAGVVLAAGLSSRAEVAQKLLLPIEGIPMIRRAVAIALEAGLSPVVVVTGHDADEVEATIAGLPVEVVRNPAPEKGLAGSLALGVSALPVETAGAAILLGDMPWVQPTTVRTLAATLSPSEMKTVVVPRVNGRRGNPLVWGRAHFDELKGLAGDIGARSILDRHADRTAWVETDDRGVLRDVDRVEDLPPDAPPSEGDDLVIRGATLDDLPALLELESAAFTSDRITRRSMRHLLQRAHAAVLVAELPAGGLVGSVVLLFSRGTATVRLYSIAVDPAVRGRGIARRLVGAAEAEAWRHERAWVRLEVRRDNPASIGLFESLGYRRFGVHADYYSDHMEALRFEKAVDAGRRPELVRVPYYRQTLDFTCGPAALIMALAALDPELQPDRALEIRLWREATTVFMTSGHGGCGPYGLALAAWKRGWATTLHLSAEGVQLLESVRSPEKKEVMALVQVEMEREVAQLGMPVHYGRISPDSLEGSARDGAIPLVLISSWAIYGTHAPHWVVVTGFDEHFVYVHDPFIDSEEGETAADSINMPIGRPQFDRMARYGRRGLQAAVLVGPRRRPEGAHG